MTHPAAPVFKDPANMVSFSVLLFVRLQLVANTVLFTSVNLSGLFVRILTERAQRKAFLQARNCIEERLRMEDENEKQVRAPTGTHPSKSEPPPTNMVSQSC